MRGTTSRSIRPALTSVLLGFVTLALLGITMHTGAQSESKSAPAAAQSAKGNVLITGANRGIGLALAQQFKTAGYQVIGTARTPGEAKELAETGARVMQLDVADAKSVRALAEALKDQPIDILVNNAGISGSRGSIDALDVDAVERVLAVNTIGPMRVTQALLPNLRGAPRKVVISISSGLGSLAGNTSGGHYGYRESKAAINMFMRSIAADLKDEGFTCVAISPGWVRTDMGGPQATLSPADSAAGIVKVIESLKTSDTGAFYAHDGKTVAW